MDVERQIDVLIRARYSIIYIVSWEEERVLRTLREIARKRNKKLFTWTVTQGLVEDGGRKVDATTIGAGEALDFALEQDDSAIFVMCDLDPFVEDARVQRKLRDVAHSFRASYKTLIVVSPVLKIPSHLEKDVTVIDYSLPDEEELARLLDRIVNQVRDNPNVTIDLEPEGREVLVKAALGLTASEAEDAFARSVVINGHLGPEDIEVVLTEKEQIIRKSGILEFHSADERFANVGGLDGLKTWLEKRGKAFTEKAREVGLPQPKGALLIGVQGCGKSLTAKAVGSLWQLPLLRLDVGSVFGSYIGSSEQNMRRVMRLSESISPCILWLDELEKGFAGMQSPGVSDSGTTARVFASFITWLQEKTAPVFVIATATTSPPCHRSLCARGALTRYSSSTCRRWRSVRTYSAYIFRGATAILRSST